MVKLTGSQPFSQVWHSPVLDRMMVKVLYAFAPLVRVIVPCRCLENWGLNAISVSCRLTRKRGTCFKGNVENGRQEMRLGFGGFPRRGVSFSGRLGLPAGTPGFE